MTAPESPADPAATLREAARVDLEPRLVLTESALIAAVLVGVSGEHDPVPTQAQLDRVVRLAWSAHERLSDESLTRLLDAVLGGDAS